MISLTERTILDKRTLGCICDHGTTECKDIITLFESNRGYCSVYVCNKDLRVDKADDILCHSEGVARRISFKACKRSFAYAQDDAQSTALNDDRCRNMIKPMHNDQNGLVVMFSSAKRHKAQETKPETDRNQIQNKLWQKQSNRNISTCVAQREVA